MANGISRDRDTAAAYQCVNTPITVNTLLQVMRLTPRIFHQPTIMRSWKVFRALLLTFKSRSARRALNAPMALEIAPSLMSSVTTLIQRVISTTASINPQELRRYAFGVHSSPSAMILIAASTVKTMANAMSVQMYQFLKLKA